MAALQTPSKTAAGVCRVTLELDTVPLHKNNINTAISTSDFGRQNGPLGTQQHHVVRICEQEAIVQVNLEQF